MSQQTIVPSTAPQTLTETALEEFRKAGAPIEKATRAYKSKTMTGFNAEVYGAWIDRWANNAASNYPIVRRSTGVAFLRNAAKNVPAVVVGIGPSLDDEIEALKIATRHAVIIATDAALRPLLRHGIKPDLIVNYDARDEQKTMWETLDTSGLVMLANSVTSPLTVDAWNGKVMFFNMMQGDDEFATNILPCMFPYTGQLPNQGTVGNGAVFLAYQMGCSPILTVGMDLCYREQNGAIPGTIIPGVWRYRCKDWHHVPSTPELPDGVWEEIQNKTLYDNDLRLKHARMEKIKEREYMTDDLLHFYRNSLVSSVGRLDMPLINCSGGVMSELVKSMTLRDAIEQKCYAALDPARTTAKHLYKLIDDGKAGWTLAIPDRVFIPTSKASLVPPTHKR